MSKTPDKDGVFTAICVAIAEGRSLRSICKDEGMPALQTVMRWLGAADGAPYRDQYARAREAQAEAFAEEILEIADDGTNDWMERTASDGSTTTVVDHEHISRSKLRVDTRKWLMSKMLPKKYGDRVEHTMVRRRVEDMTDDELAAIAAGGGQGDSAEEAPTGLTH